MLNRTKGPFSVVKSLAQLTRIIVGDRTVKAMLIGGPEGPRQDTNRLYSNSSFKYFKSF